MNFLICDSLFDKSFIYRAPRRAPRRAYRLSAVSVASVVSTLSVLAIAAMPTAAATFKVTYSGNLETVTDTYTAFASTPEIAVTSVDSGIEGEYLFDEDSSELIFSRFLVEPRRNTSGTVIGPLERTFIPADVPSLQPEVGFPIVTGNTSSADATSVNYSFSLQTEPFGGIEENLNVDETTFSYRSSSARNRDSNESLLEGSITQFSVVPIDDSSQTPVAIPEPKSAVGLLALAGLWRLLVRRRATARQPKHFYQNISNL